MSKDEFQLIQNLVSKAPETIGLIIKVNHEQKLVVNANKAFRSASLIKLAILNDVLDSHFDLDKEIHVRRDKLVGGAGVLQLLSERIFQLKDLLALMISVSDNSATNLVIDLIGMDHVNQYLSKMGFYKTRLNRYLMDTNALENGKDNYTTPAESQRLLEMAIANHPMTKTWFLNQQFRYKLPGDFDETGNGIQVYNKTGEGYQIDHDVAEFVYGNKVISIALLTFGSRSRMNTIRLFNDVGELGADFLSR